MMTDKEVAVLKARVKEGGVLWRNPDGVCKPVLSIKMDWVEFEDQPELTEPAAMLPGGEVVALDNVSACEFVVLVPAIVPTQTEPNAMTNKPKVVASIKLSANEAECLVKLATAVNGRMSCFHKDASARYLNSLARKSMCEIHKRGKEVVGWEITALGRERCKSIY